MKTLPVSKHYVAIVDDDDYEHLNRYKWYALCNKPKNKTAEYSHQVYAYRSVRQKGRAKSILMHRDILGALCIGKLVDHKDGNSLNNQRSNLRICSSSQNMGNQKTQTRAKYSAYKGVTFQKRDNRWYARIKIRGKQRHLGSFSNPKDAARAYNKAALDAWGEFALLNEIKP